MKRVPAQTSFSAKSTGKLFFSGVLVLTMSTVAVKVIGLLLKILLFDSLGEDGMAYYNAAYTIYSAFYILSTAGFPVAVSILISESRARGDIKRVRQIFWIAFGLFVGIGIAGMSVMMGGSNFFAERIGMPGAAAAIRAIAPTLFLICISSAIRGYFQGYQIMFPTAVSQILEAAGKLTLGMILASYAISRGYSHGTVAAYAIFGVTLGVAVSMLFVVLTGVFYRPRDVLVCEAEPVRSCVILGRLVRIAIPVTVSALVMSLTQIIDTLLIVSRLQDAGFVGAVAERMYGNYTTLVIPLFNITPSMIAPISMALVPMLTLAIESGERSRRRDAMDAALRLTVMIAMPCAIGLSVFSRPILRLLFSGKGESVEMAAPLLSFLAISVLFVALLNVTNAILQAYGHERKPIYSMLAGSAIKIAVSYFLIGMPAVNLFGAPLGTFLCYLTVTVMNFCFIARHTGDLKGVVHLLLKPLLAAVGSIGTALAVYLLLSSRVGGYGWVTLLSVFLAVPLYAVLILLLRAVDERDVRMLPLGEQIAALLKRIKLLK